MSESVPAEVEAPVLPVDNEPGPSQVAAIENKRYEKRPFYFDDTLVVLQASHTITAFLLALFTIPLQVDEETYKIHRHFLTRESRYFKNLFSLPQPRDSTGVEGSDNNPIKIPETDTSEFESLLRFFYFGYGTCYRFCSNG